MRILTIDLHFCALFTVYRRQCQTPRQIHYHQRRVPRRKRGNDVIASTSRDPFALTPSKTREDWGRKGIRCIVTIINSSTYFPRVFAIIRSFCASMQRVLFQFRNENMCLKITRRMCNLTT